MKLQALLIVAASLMIAAKPAEDANKKDLEKLQGTWKAVSGKNEGKDIPADRIEKLRLIFKGNKVTPMEGENKEDEATITLDASKKPATIDIETGKEKIPGIYKIEGDTLTICFDEEGKKRPTAFESKSGTNVRLYVFKREKP